MDNYGIDNLLEYILKLNGLADTPQNTTSVKLNDEDLDDLLNTVKSQCDSVYDSMSIDSHELIWSKNGVEAHLAIGYNYADIIGLDPEQFEYIHKSFEKGGEE